MEDVISGMKDAFNDEGVDEQVLIELKQLWENKLTSSKAIDPVLDPAEMSLQNRLQRSEFNSNSYLLKLKFSNFCLISSPTPAWPRQCCFSCS